MSDVETSSLTPLQLLDQTLLDDLWQKTAGSRPWERGGARSQPLDTLLSRIAAPTGDTAAAKVSSAIDRPLLAEILELLEASGSFNIRLERHTLRGEGPELKILVPRAAITPMWPMGTNVWIRDLAKIASRLMSGAASGIPQAASWRQDGLELLMSGVALLSTPAQLKRFENVIKHEGDPHLLHADLWPHIFLNIESNLHGETAEPWSHKQDAWQMLVVYVLDALESGQVKENALTAAERKFLGLAIPFLAKTEFWKHETSGSWEELPAVRSSVIVWDLAVIDRIATAIAQGRLQFLHEEFASFVPYLQTSLAGSTLATCCKILAEEGAKQLLALLPNESPGYSTDDPRFRDADAAAAYHLMLDAPQMVSRYVDVPSDWIATMQQQIVGGLLSLQDPVTRGIRRYRGDSYQGLNYFTHETVARLEAICGGPSGDASGLEAFKMRAAAITPGYEAAWCHPLWQMIGYAAKQSMRDKSVESLAFRNELLLQGLGALTGDNEWTTEKTADGILRNIPIDSLRFTEAWLAVQYRGEVRYIPSPHTPLQWCVAEAMQAMALVWQSMSIELPAA